MRRSNSASSIPLPMSLQNRRESRERMRSSIAKGKDNPYQLAPRRELSTEHRTPDIYSKRDPSLENNTPAYKKSLFGSDRKFSNPKERKRSASLSSYGSRGSSINRMTKSPGSKSVMQQQMNDKKWVEDNFKKIQEYIRTSGNFDPELSRQLKPPTLATFVQITSDLLNQIFKNIHLNVQNYGDIIIQNLKLLRYPCQVNSSTLKTINTKHAHSHFVSIISWLIDKVNTTNIMSDFIENQDIEVQKSLLIDQEIVEFMGALVPSESQDNPNQEELERNLCDGIAEIIGADKEKAMQQEEILNCAKRDADLVQEKLQEILAENANILAENLRKMEVIKQYEESDKNREQTLKDEIEQLTELLAKHAEHRANILKSIKDLEEGIANQVCTHTQKLEMLNEIEELKRSIERKERQLAEFWNIRVDLDHKRSTLVREIENKVDEWNLCIVKSFLPELNELKLRTKGFSSQGFLEEILEVRKQSGDLQEVLCKEYKNNLSELESLEKQKIKLFETNMVMDSTRKRLDRLKQCVQELEDKHKQLLMNTEVFEAHHKNSIKKIMDLGNTKQEECKGRIEELSRETRKLKKEIYNTAKEGIEICASERNNVLNIARQVEEAHQIALNDNGRKLIKSQNEAQRILNIVEQLAEANALLK
ncbi:golgin subfamily A member 4-like [Anthonomus grandis grandis]|uniref:golgin subfamily A member 4-like n=1 Tax=Anthonomus grandis grandis TaxID=2921223 RepID=UPI0021667B0D|nr:golgin subfamily A member 4-like [Anthonomus grandis grandis]